jgi:hypothetical protein
MDSGVPAVNPLPLVWKVMKVLRGGGASQS